MVDFAFNMTFKQQERTEQNSFKQNNGKKNIFKHPTETAKTLKLKPQKHKCTHTHTHTHTQCV